jgi:hypothetical protein
VIVAILPLYDGEALLIYKLSDKYQAQQWV